MQKFFGRRVFDVRVVSEGYDMDNRCSCCG
eukprot:ctg_6758.g710